MDDELLIETSESRRTLSASMDDDKAHQYPDILILGDNHEAHKALDWRRPARWSAGRTVGR